MLLGALTYLLFWLALPVLLFHPKLRHGLRERLGLHRHDWPGAAADAPRIWLHGASAGDIGALMPLVRELHARRPELQIIVSTITNSGRAMLERQRDGIAAITYAPYDLPGAVRRTLARIRPLALVLEVTELWPQLIGAAHRRGVAVVMHNGRLAAPRLGRYRLLFRFTGNLLQQLRLLLMRDDTEAERALSLGAAPERVHVTGNTKFDNLDAGPSSDQVDALRRATGFTNSARIWVAGSTHDGEDERLLDVFERVRAQLPDLRMVIAPRYVDRSGRILASARGRGLVAHRRTTAPEEPLRNPDLMVLDTIGELFAAYALADLVFVGGSFVPRGGHNILEPASLGKPVLFGPHMQNVQDSVHVLLGRGGIQVANAEQLAQAVRDLVADRSACQSLGAIARERVMAVRGAAARNAELILAALSDASSSK